MRRMRIGDADVMNMARDQGLKTLDDIDTATLERNGQISIIPVEEKEEGDDDNADASERASDGKQNKASDTQDKQPEDKQARDKQPGGTMANEDDSSEKERKDAPRAVGDTVPKVDNAVAVGEDLTFQRRWWKFENFIWSLFALVLLADVAGLLGNGPLAHTQRKTQDGSLVLQYDRIERATTPNTMTIKPGAQAVQNGRIVLFVSDSVVKELGAQRIAPQPAVSAIGNGGITYLFPAVGGSSTIQFGLQPAKVGFHTITVGVPGGEQLQARVLVLP